MHEVSTEWTARGYWITLADADGNETNVMVRPGRPVYGCRLDIEVGHVDRRSKLDYTEPECAWVEACSPADKPAILAAFSVWAANVLADHLKADGASALTINFGCDNRIVLQYVDRELEPTIMEARASFMSYRTESDIGASTMIDAAILKTALDNAFKPL